MKSILSKFRTLVVIGMVALLAACTKVPAGNVGVKFDLYGGDKGVTGEVVGPGRYWLGWNEDLYMFPTFTQNEVWTLDSIKGSETDESISFQDMDGVQINADVGISYAVRGDKADVVFQKYRKGIDEITDLYIRNMVRDAINSETAKLKASEIYSSKKEDLMIAVTQRVRAQVEEIGIEVEKIYWIGAMRLPPQIVGAINAKIETVQKAEQRENELQTARAQAEIEREKARGEADAKMIAAKAEADANALINASVTQNLIQYIEAQRWNGSKATVITGGVTPMLDVGKERR